MQSFSQNPGPLQAKNQVQATPAKVRRGLMIAGLLMAFFVGFFAGLPVESSQQQHHSAGNFADVPQAAAIPTRPSQLLMPANTLSPQEVVEIQLQALSTYRQNRAAIHQVFAHASPSNRAVTGPLEKFEQMLLNQQYRPLVVSKHHMVGRAIEKGKVATVLVSTVDEQGRLSVFRFLLSRQTDVYPGCWMTDGVFRLIGDWRPGEALPNAMRLPTDKI